MRLALVVTGLLGLIGMVWPMLRQTGTAGALSQQSLLVASAGESIKVEGDGPEVFRRAFGRQPAEEDLIYRAEHRQWVATNDRQVLRWQWFIELKPGPELVAVLQDEAAFGLRRTASPASWAKLATPPQWFPRGTEHSGEIFQSELGAMTLIYSPDTGQVFATGEGHGMNAPTVSK